MNVILEKLMDDGSSWTAVVEVKKTKLVASYIDGQIQVHVPATARNNYLKTPQWMRDYVKIWAQETINNLPSDWHQKHTALYGK